MVIVMKKLLMPINLVDKIENKWDRNYIQILPAPAEDAMENIGEDLHY